MTEWHVTPDYIVNNWTDEQLDLYIGKLVERKHRETGKEPRSQPSKDHSVSVETLSAMSHGMIKVVKKDGD